MAKVPLDETLAAFSRRGFYLHACWEYEYPFAVRTWSRDEYVSMFRLLRSLGFNMVMLWPLAEAIPAPMSEEDRMHLSGFRELVDEAHQLDMECWVTLAPNVMSRPEIAEKPLLERHLYPFRVDVRLDDPDAREAFFKHRATILEVLNNADAYVTIDGDPGGYPGARPEEFLQIFQFDREVLNRVGSHPETQKLVPWMWCGWGNNWAQNGPWSEDIEPLTMPLLDLLKREMTEPWELLPGRSIRDGWANGRVNFDYTERSGLIDRSVLMCYEIIEYEPTPPAVVLQFDDIRRVLREESKYLGEARGIMGNAQQPIMTLPNLFLFARATVDPGYLERTDIEVLTDLATWLDGDVDVLVQAWRSLDLALEELSSDLPARIRASALRSETAGLLPGGPERYLEILAAQVEARLAVLAAAEVAVDDSEAVVRVALAAMKSLVEWWRVHRYVYSGEKGTHFRAEWTHPKLLQPLAEWGKALGEGRASLVPALISQLTESGLLEADVAREEVPILLGYPD